MPGMAGMAGMTGGMATMPGAGSPQPQAYGAAQQLERQKLSQELMQLEQHFQHTKMQLGHARSTQLLEIEQTGMQLEAQAQQARLYQQMAEKAQTMVPTAFQRPRDVAPGTYGQMPMGPPGSQAPGGMGPPMHGQPA